MKKMTKLLALVMAAVMICGMFAGCGGSTTAPTAAQADKPAETQAAAPAETAAPAEEAPAEEAGADFEDKDGDVVINLWSFTDEVPKMVARYRALHPEFDAKYKVVVTIVPTTDQLYQPALDQALNAGGADAPDLYTAEAAFVLKYTQGDASGFAATYEELGIDVAGGIAAADIAPYTVDIGTRPADGKVVGLGYQATGGAFIYRRSIAQDVWGTDDPAVVAEKIGAGTNSWDQFFAAAAELKAKGYGIVSGDGDIWHACENASAKGWIVDGELNIDPAREQFLDLSKELMDNGYHNDTRDWTDAWFADMKGEGAQGILGFYGPAWLVNYTLAPNCGGEQPGEGTYGDWAVCAPNIGFFWGGTWLLGSKYAAADSAKAAGVAELINWITLDCSDTGLQYGWANGSWDATPSTKDCVGSGTVMAKSNGELDFLGGQNMFDAFVPANAYANGKCLTQYDEAINGYFRDAVRQYTAGELTRDEAIAAFKQNVADNLDVIVK